MGTELFLLGGARRVRTADLNTASVRTSLLHKALKVVCHQTVTKRMFLGQTKRGYYSQIFAISY